MFHTVFIVASEESFEVETIEKKARKKENMLHEFSLSLVGKVRATNIRDKVAVRHWHNAITAA